MNGIQENLKLEFARNVIVHGGIEKVPREIPLSRGKVALVDDEDYERVAKYQWYSKKEARRGKIFYAEKNLPEGTSQRRSHIKMQYFIKGKAPQGLQIDHIDGNGLNNQKANLRYVTPRENAQNKHNPRSSCFPGVSWDKERKKWRSVIQKHGKQKYLGRFNNELDASNAYKNAIDEIEDE